MIENRTVEEFKAYKNKLKSNKSVKLYIKILNGKEKGFPYKYWKNKSEEDFKMCLRYLIDVELDLDFLAIKNIKIETFRIYFLENAIKEIADNDIFKALDMTYPNTFIITDLKYHKKNTLSKDLGAQCLRDYVKRANISRDELLNVYSREFIKNAGLEYVVRKFYDNKIKNLLVYTYPNVYKDYELVNLKEISWNEETVSKAVRDMIDKLEWSRDDVVKNINKQVFIENGLEGMLRGYCSNSPFVAIDIAFPGEYKKFEFAVGKNYWNVETGVEAFKFMIEKKLKYTNDDIKNKLCRNDFIDNKLVYMLDNVFDGDIYEIVNKSYPKVFKKRDLKKISKSRKREKGTLKDIKNSIL